MPGKTPALRSDQAIALLASAAGAMLLARAVDNEEFSQRILRVMRSAIGEMDERSQPRRVAGTRSRASSRRARESVT